MRHIPTFAAIAVSLAVAPTQASAEGIKAKAYAPQGEWRLNSVGDGCTLIRDFKSGENRLKFTIQQVHPGSIMQFGIFGDAVEKPDEAIDAGFLPADATGSFDMWAEAAVGGLDGYVFAGLPFPALSAKASNKEARVAARAAYLERVEGSEMYLVRGMSQLPLALQTGSMKAPMEALEGCIEDKLAAMGLTDEVRDATKRGPKPDGLKNWSRKVQQGYPRRAVYSRWDGTVNLRLVIDEKGRVEHCHVVTQMTAKVLRDHACEQLKKHGRFEPAQDTEGKAVQGLYLTSIRYVMPTGSPFSADAHGFKIGDKW